MALSCPAIALSVACSSFDEEPTPDPTAEAGTEAGSDATPTTDASADDVVTVDAGPIVCPGSACTVLASGQNDAREIVSDGTRAFWTIATSGNGAVRSVALAGGSTQVVSGQEDQPKSLQLFDDLAYYATGTAAHQVRQDGATEAGAKLFVGSGRGNISSVARFGATLYFTYEAKLGRCTLATSPCPGSSPTFTVGNGTAALSPAPDGPPYFVHANAIWQAAADANSADFRFEVPKVRALLVDATNVYFLTTGVKDVAALGRTDDRAATPRILAATTDEPRAMAIDGADLYFTTLETGTVTRVAKFGASTPVVVVKGLVSPQGIAVTKDRILVVADGSIISLPKAH